MFLALLTAYAAHVAAVEPCKYGVKLDGKMKYWDVPQNIDPYAAATQIVADIKEALGDDFAGSDCPEAAIRRELLRICSLTQYVVQATEAASSPPPLPPPPPGALAKVSESNPALAAFHSIGSLLPAPLGWSAGAGCVVPAVHSSFVPTSSDLSFHTSSACLSQHCLCRVPQLAFEPQ